MEDLLLAYGEPSRMGLGCRTCTCRNGADAKVSHRPRTRRAAASAPRSDKPYQRLSKHGLVLGVEERQSGFIAVAQPIPEFGGSCTISGDL